MSKTWYSIKAAAEPSGPVDLVGKWGCGDPVQVQTLNGRVNLTCGCVTRKGSGPIPAPSPWSGLSYQRLNRAVARVVGIPITEVGM